MSIVTINNTTEEEVRYHTKIIEEYLFFQRDILRKYYNVFPKYLNPTSDYYAVIVEPRSNHPLLEAVCRNVMYFLPRNWNLVIYSYDEENIKSILPDIEYLFFKTSKTSFNSIEYSNLLMSSEFWNSIPGNNILIFQTDSYMMRKLDDIFLGEISKYSFIGAPYKIQDNCFPIDINIVSPLLYTNYSINGGFSFRSKAAMLDCIQRITLDQIKEYRNKNGLIRDLLYIEYEDVYFEHALYLLHYQLPPYELSQLFCTQVYYTLINTYAIHGFHRDYVNKSLIFLLHPPLYEINNEIIIKINKFKENGVK